MPELGIRGNVMGPQPIAERQPLPPEMLKAAGDVIAMLARGDADGLAAISLPVVTSEICQITMGIKPGSYHPS
jgi:hypothetical protein